MKNPVVQRALELRRGEFLFNYGDDGHKDCSTSRGGHIDYDRGTRHSEKYADHSERYSDSVHTDERTYGDYSERSTHTDCNSRSSAGEDHIDRTRKYGDYEDYKDYSDVHSDSKMWPTY